MRTPSRNKAAIAEGVLPGAGLALLRAIDAVNAEEAKAEDDEKTGLRILKRALEYPTRQIAENSALDGGMVVDRLRSGKGNSGLDASTCKYVDLIASTLLLTAHRRTREEGGANARARIRGLGTSRLHRHAEAMREIPEERAPSARSFQSLFSVLRHCDLQNERTVEMQIVEER